MRNLVGLFAGIAAVCAFFSSCASTKVLETSSADISGDWILSSLEYDADLYDGYDAAADFIADLENSGKTTGISFSADKTTEDVFVVYGFSGVNSYNGTVSFNGGSLLENPPAATLVSGAPKAERFERVFLQMLAKVETASVSSDDSTLTMADTDGANVMVFKRFELADTSWGLSAYNTGNAVVSLPTQVDIPTLIFGDAGNLSGSTGVNRMTGSFSSDSKTRALSFGPLGTTRMAPASPQLGELEAAYLELLGKAVSYRISGSSLTLCDADGKSLLVFYMM